MAFQPDEIIQPMAYSIDSFSKVSSLGTTIIRAAIKRGDLRTRKCGERHIIPVKWGQDWLDSLPENNEA